MFQISVWFRVEEPQHGWLRPSELLELLLPCQEGRGQRLLQEAVQRQTG